MATEKQSIPEPLPEILEMILSHLDELSGKEAALVCPNFYQHVCYSNNRRPQILNLYFTVS